MCIHIYINNNILHLIVVFHLNVHQGGRQGLHTPLFVPMKY